jgi:hypothetical protein
MENKKNECANHNCGKYICMQDDCPEKCKNEGFIKDTLRMPYFYRCLDHYKESIKEACFILICDEVRRGGGKEESRYRKEIEAAIILYKIECEKVYSNSQGKIK